MSANGQRKVECAVQVTCPWSSVSSLRMDHQSINCPLLRLHPPGQQKEKLKQKNKQTKKTKQSAASSPTDHSQTTSRQARQRSSGEEWIDHTAVADAPARPRHPAPARRQRRSGCGARSSAGCESPFTRCDPSWQRVITLTRPATLRRVQIRRLRMNQLRRLPPLSDCDRLAACSRSPCVAVGRPLRHDAFASAVSLSLSLISPPPPCSAPP